MKERYTAGDDLAKVAEPVAKFFGKDPKKCTGCQSRRGILNRRGWIGTILLGAFLAKDFFVRKSWQLAAAELPPLEPSFALGFFRQAMTVQRSAYMFGNAHLSKPDLLAKVLEHREHFSVDSGGYAWMSVLTPAAPQALPGWTLDVVLTQKGYPRAIGAESFDRGFRMSLRGPMHTFLGDESGLIYRVANPSAPIDLTRVSEAMNFPGAINIGEIHDEAAASKPTILERVSNFFVPKAYASCILCTSCCASQCCCYLCGCLTCLTRCSDCCGTGQCGDSPSENSCYFDLGCGGCTYLSFACGTNDCSCCLQLFNGCCTPTTGCTGGCGSRCGHRC